MVNIAAARVQALLRVPSELFVVLYSKYILLSSGTGGRRRPNSDAVF